ncbi:hypothetical protein ABZX90_11885 [Streptomyces sp. NPDC002935]|uniref:hypothetical protein n=1 Tax=Streptomyces sp. NPDC002935 TaxID=3154545 RepID=UPI0033B00480
MPAHYSSTAPAGSHRTPTEGVTSPRTSAARSRSRGTSAVRAVSLRASTVLAVTLLALGLAQAPSVSAHVMPARADSDAEPLLSTVTVTR